MNNTRLGRTSTAWTSAAGRGLSSSATRGLCWIRSRNTSRDSRDLENSPREGRFPYIPSIRRPGLGVRQTPGPRAPAWPSRSTRSSPEIGGQTTVAASLEVASENTNQVARMRRCGLITTPSRMPTPPQITPADGSINPARVFIQLMGEGDTGPRARPCYARMSAFSNMRLGGSQALSKTSPRANGRRCGLSRYRSRDRTEGKMASTRTSKASRYGRDTR